MKTKNIILCVLLLTVTCFVTYAQKPMGKVGDAKVSYDLRSYASDLMPGNYGSDEAPVAILYLKDAQQRVCANLYFYASDNVMQHQQASRDRDTGLVEDHYNFDFYQVLFDALKDRALQHTLVYDLDTNKVKLQSNPRSSGVKSPQLRSPKIMVK